MTVVYEFRRMVEEVIRSFTVGGELEGLLSAPTLGTGATTSAWTDWTPTLTQSAGLTFTINYCRYKVIGKTAIVQASLSITSAGTANNVIQIGSVPAAIAVRWTGNMAVCGAGVYNSGGVDFRNLMAVAGTSTTFKFLQNYTGAAITDFFGFTAGGGITAKNTDVLSFDLTYEVA